MTKPTENQPVDKDASVEDALRADIARTRAELGDTVEALAHKADVPGRAKQKATEVKETVAVKVDNAVGSLPEPAADKVHNGLRAIAAHPVPTALAALGGFLVVTGAVKLAAK